MTSKVVLLHGLFRRHLPRRPVGAGGRERLGAGDLRRTNAVGAFPDRSSALRMVTAVSLNVTAIWTDRRYLDMSLLESKEVAVAKAA